MSGEYGDLKLNIRLFGAFELRLHGERVSDLRTRKGQLLLALLILRRDTEVERSWLAGCLWPTSFEELALGSLRQSLAAVRRALGPESHRLQTPTMHTVSFDITDVDIDVLTFDEEIRKQTEAAMERAVALYRGPLLEGFDAEWIGQERSSREFVYLSALDSLAAAGTAAGRFREAEGLLRRLLQIDPYRESAHRGVMQALAAAGDYTAAIQSYRELRLRLHRELRLEPDAETVVLFNRICVEARRNTSSGSSETPRSAAVLSPPEESLAEEAVPLSWAGVVPEPLTPLIGRGREIEEIGSALLEERLLTLTGPGGIGKTRLAIAVAQHTGSKYPHGVKFVELTAVVEANQVISAVAAAVGVHGRSDGTPEADLIRVIQARRMMLVLDNCEHLVASCARLAETLLRNCPGLSILVTSREVLGLPGEHVWRVPSLSLRQSTGVRTNDSRPAAPPEWCEAVRLFVARARAARPDFVMIEEDGRLATSICESLDGIPLAIELAAARTRSLSVQQILSRLNDRFRLLAGGTRTAIPHHQTLRALVDLSYDPLSEKEKRLLHRLAVFARGWTLEHAEQVCYDVEHEGPVIAVGDAPQMQRALVREHEIVELLGLLVEKSLVQFEIADNAPRYRLLETIRHYALERLDAAGERREIEQRHSGTYAALAAQLAVELNGPRAGECLKQYRAEHDNIHCAFQWSLDNDDAPDVASTLCSSIMNFWLTTGSYSEGRDWCSKALRHPQSQANLLSRSVVFTAAGTLAWMHGDLIEAHNLNSEALAIRRALGTPRQIAISLERLGAVTLQRGATAEARRLLEESVALLRPLGDIQLLITALINFGCAAEYEQDYDAARSIFEEALALAKSTGNRKISALPLANLADLCEIQGDMEQCALLNEESLQLMTEFGDKRGIASVLYNLGHVALFNSDFPRSRELLNRSLLDWRDLGNKLEMVMGVEAIAYLLLAQSLQAHVASNARCLQAARLFGACDTVRKALHCIEFPKLQLRFRLQLEHLGSSLAPETLESTRAAGRRMTLEAAVTFALETE